MTSLADIVRLRHTKQADVAQVVSRIVPEVVEEGVNQGLRKLTNTPRDQAPRPRKRLPRSQEDEALNQQYRKSRNVSAPVSPGELGVSTALNVGSNYAVPRVLNKIPLKALHGELPHVGEAALQTYGPKYIPLTIATAMGINHLMAPMSDPLYRQGRRGYLESVSEGIGGSADALAERGREARGRYGVGGIPVQMVHGILNPVASLAYGGRSLHNLMRSKEGSDLAMSAEQSIRDALNESNQV